MRQNAQASAVDAGEDRPGKKSDQYLTREDRKIRDLPLMAKSQLEATQYAQHRYVSRRTQWSESGTRIPTY